MSDFLSSRMQKWRNAWSLKFYLRVYLAVLAGLVVTTIILYVLIQVAMNDTKNFKRNMENFSYIASSVIPPEGSSKAAEIEAIKQWGFWLDMDLTVFKLDGSLSSSTKPQPLTHLPSNIRTGWYTTLPDKVAIQLNDQRWIIVDMSRRIFVPSGMQIIGAILVVLGIALGSYPLVRRLTKRLEHLQTSVEALGEGKLGTRVEVEGNDEVARLAISFNQASARIEALMNAQKSLLANASHELRSPLMRISMATELMMQSAPENLRKELKTNIQELDQLIDEILLSSRLEATKETVSELEPIDFVGLVAEECARVNAQLQIDVNQNRLQDISAMNAEGKLLRRLIRNLLENAQRYGNNTPIDVILATDSSLIVLEVCDLGTGIPADQCERVFEPFYRLPGTSESNGGVGLGLNLVKQIAERHHGKVVCLPRHGGGTCFRLTLPTLAN